MSTHKFATINWTEASDDLEIPVQKVKEWRNKLSCRRFEHGLTATQFDHISDAITAEEEEEWRCKQIDTLMDRADYWSNFAFVAVVALIAAIGFAVTFYVKLRGVA